MSRAISLSFRRSSHHRVSAVIDQPDALRWHSTCRSRWNLDQLRPAAKGHEDAWCGNRLQPITA